MNLRQAAEMALEALEDIFGKEKKDVGAINALRQALAQPDEVLAERERKSVIETIDELMGMESDRHPMFSEGYDHALDHIKQFVQGRGKK
jgi:chaperonin GroEL (HSP60 family)